MLELILALLILFWLTGYLQVPLFSQNLFTLAGHVITFSDLLTFFVIIWLLDILPYPFRQIAMVLFLLWILGIFGIVSLTGFPTIVMIALIVGLIGFITRGRITSTKGGNEIDD